MVPPGTTPDQAPPRRVPSRTRCFFTGPLNFQDGSEYLADGVEATDYQIWYTPQLLEGMTGDSE